MPLISCARVRLGYSISYCVFVYAARDHSPYELQPSYTQNATFPQTRINFVISFNVISKTLILHLSLFATFVLKLVKYIFFLFIITFIITNLMSAHNQWPK